MTKIHSPWDIPGTEIGMMPLYLAQIEDLRQGEFVKVDCAACHHVALLTPEGFKGRFRCADAEGRGELSFRSNGGSRSCEAERADLTGGLPTNIRCDLIWLPCLG